MTIHDDFLVGLRLDQYFINENLVKSANLRKDKILKKIQALQEGSFILWHI